MVLEDDKSGIFNNGPADPNELRIRAEVARHKLNGEGEGSSGLVFAIDDDGNPDAVEIEESYDALVPGYFR